jgi:putative holliday junction resolvase
VNTNPRILAIDPGGRRMGLAVSDELGITAQGLETFDTRTGDFLEHVSKLIGTYGISRVVVGYPISMSGRPNETSRKSKDLALEIGDRLGVDVVLWDERLTSAEARRTLAGRKADKKTVDKIAAVLILQSFMDSGGTGGVDPGSFG